MKYIDESKAFFEALEFNQLSAGQISLWFVLFSMENKARWQGWFSLANGRLASLAGLSVSGMKKARDVLKDKGFIDFKPQGKNKSSKYRIVSMVNSSDYQDSDQQSVRQSTRQSVRQSNQQRVTKVTSKRSLNKDKDKTKTKTIVNQSVAGENHLLKSFNLWEQNWGFPNTIAQQDLTEWIKHFGDDLVAWVIKYALRRNISAKGADRYLAKAFNHYEKEGITTVEQAEAEAKQHQERVNREIAAKRPSWRKPQRTETPPKWQQDEAEGKPVKKTTAQQEEDVKALIASLHSDEEEGG